MAEGGVTTIVTTPVTTTTMTTTAQQSAWLNWELPFTSDDHGEKRKPRYCLPPQTDLRDEAENVGTHTMARQGYYRDYMHQGAKPKQVKPKTLTLETYESDMELLQGEMAELKGRMEQIIMLLDPRVKMANEDTYIESEDGIPAHVGPKTKHTPSPQRKKKTKTVNDMVNPQIMLNQTLKNSKLPHFIEEYINEIPIFNITQPDQIVEFLIAIHKINTTCQGFLGEIVARTSLRANGSSGQILRDLAQPNLSWENLRSTLLQYISPRDLLRLKYQRLYAFQTENQPYRDFADSLITNGTVLGISEAETVQLVISGAAPGTRCYFNFKQLPESFKTLEELLREVENLMSTAARREAELARIDTTQPKYTIDPYERFPERGKYISQQRYNPNLSNVNRNRKFQNNNYNHYRQNQNNYYQQRNSMRNNYNNNRYRNNNNTDRYRNNYGYNQNNYRYNRNNNKFNQNKNENYNGGNYKTNEYRNKQNQILPMLNLPEGFQWNITPIANTNAGISKANKNQNNNSGGKSKNTKKTKNKPKG